MKSFKFFLLIFLLLIPLSNAALDITSNLGDYTSQNTSKSIQLYVISPSLSVTNITCSTSISDNSGNIVYQNTTNSQGPFILNNTVLTTKGSYNLNSMCNTSLETGLLSHSFIVSKSGNQPSNGLFTGLIYLIFIAAFVGSIYFFFMTIANLATTNETIYDVLITWAFLILTVIVIHLGQEYLLNSYVETLSETFLTILQWTNTILPVVAFIVTIFFKSTQKKRLLSVEELRGGRSG